MMGVIKCLVTWSPDSPLAHVAGEYQRHTDALNEYYAMGSTRSLAKLVKHYAELEAAGGKVPTTSIITASQWSIKYDWQARVARAEEMQNELDQAAFAKAQQEEAEMWAARRMEHRTRTYQVASDLMQSVEQMLAMLKKWKVGETETTDKDGNKVIIRTIAPGASISQLATALDTSEELLAKVLDIPDRIQRQEITGKDGMPLHDDKIVVVVHD